VAKHHITDAAVANADTSPASGRSAPLHECLDARYADTVVLTFGEIEDLAGVPLSKLAHVSHDWWTTPDADATELRFADSWILARRTARPNPRALTVTFDRVS
jgi:hypothetical protein